MVMPMSAPTIVPDIDTVPARYPSHATGALMAIAHGSADSTAACDAVRASGDMSLINHNTSAADPGTDTLSSSRTGIVSTSAATISAASGGKMLNHNGGAGITPARGRQSNAIGTGTPLNSKTP